MDSHYFQETHSRIYQLGANLLQYLKEMRENRLKEGDETKGLKSVKDEIEQALKALYDQKYQVAVVAAMKAGKSTFLNAVIGADILASESAACTVCRTDVRHVPFDQTPRLLEYQQGKRKPIVIATGDARNIQQKFLARTRSIREQGNKDRTTRFEIEHPIEAINDITSLSGFTLVDTPDPNEWDAANFNTTTLKQISLEALRTCNVILFILNYAAYKDNAISDLFKDVLENRKEILTEKGKIYFILNKIDQQGEKDPEIREVVESLKQELERIGFPNPVIYPASSRKGLLAKLIQQDKATDSQVKDFKRFFSAAYATEDEEGNQIIPAPKRIALKALEDSQILAIQEIAIQNIVRNSGWNLLNDVLAKIDKSAKAVEDILSAEIKGWEIEIESLKVRIDEYRVRSESAKGKVEEVKRKVEAQKKALIEGFSQGVARFAEKTKAQIEDEINQLTGLRSSKESNQQNNLQESNLFYKPEILEITNNEIDFSIQGIPFFENFGVSFKGKFPLSDFLKRNFSSPFSRSDSEPYKIKVQTREEARKFADVINDFCVPHIKEWWLVTQDTLVRDGTRIRQEITDMIQEDIQQISDELSDYLGHALEVELNINPIQFPKFDFPGIDAQIQHQQEVMYRLKKEEVRKSGFCGSGVEYVDVPVKEERTIYEIDLRLTLEKIKERIDGQSSESITLLQRVIENQVGDDFRKAEQQINDYINRFQDLFDNLLRDREMKEDDAPRVLKYLEAQREELDGYLPKIASIQESLNNHKLD